LKREAQRNVEHMCLTRRQATDLKAISDSREHNGLAAAMSVKAAPLVPRTVHSPPSWKPRTRALDGKDHDTALTDAVVRPDAVKAKA